MSDTTFTHGTVVQPDWLNDVNDKVYKTLASTVSVKDFGAVGDGVTDDTAAIQAAIDAGYIALVPPGVYRTTSEIVIKDGTGLIGRNPHWKRRNTYTYDGTKHAVIKYDGAGGTNTCVVRVSQKAVGSFGTVFSGANTDDLQDYRLENIHVDANDKADYGWYFYRAGNAGAVANNLTAEKAVKDGIVFLGMFAAYFGTFGSYLNGNRGIVVGDDIFNWTGSSSSEFNCYNFRATFLSAYNGTDGTFVEYTAHTTDTVEDEYGCGVFLRAGRGSKFNVGSESNDGRSVIIAANSSGTGPVEVILDYLEGNGAGPKVKAYGRSTTGVKLSGGFLYPVSATGTINAESVKIYANTVNDGPGFESEWLQLDNLFGSSGYVSWNVNSNTNKFKITNCAGAIKYLNKRPIVRGLIGKGYFKGDSTLSDTRFIEGSNIVDSFFGDASTTVFALSYTPTGQYHITVYLNGLRLTAGTNYTLAGSTLTMVTAPPNNAGLVVVYSNMRLTRTSAGRFSVAFHQAEPDSEYNVQATMVQDDGERTVAVSSKATTGFELRLATCAAPTTLSDTTDFVDFVVLR